MRFQPVLLAVDPQRELRWRGSVGVRGVFDGEHIFQLQKLAGGGTRLLHGERFSGLLVPFIMRGAMLEATRNGFIAMNTALKKRLETR
jgi:hypothetical protein